jgi:hypothetical protein
VFYLEQAAKQQIWASMLGTPEVLPDRILAHRFPAEYLKKEGGAEPSNNLWRQLVWEFEHEQAHSHGHEHSHEH